MKKRTKINDTIKDNLFSVESILDKKTVNG